MTSIRARCVLSLLLITFSQFFCTAELPVNNKEPTAEIGISNREKLGDSGPHEIPAKPCIPSKNKVEYCDGKDNDCDGEIDNFCRAPFELDASIEVFAKNLLAYFMPSFSFRQDGSQAVFAARESLVFTIQMKDKKTVQSPIKPEGLFRAIKIHPDGNSVFVAKASFFEGKSEFLVQRISLIDGKVIRSYSHKTLKSSEPQRAQLAVSADGKLLASLAGNATDPNDSSSSLALWQVSTGQTMFEKNVANIAKWGDLQFSLGSKWLAASHYPHTVKVWETRTGKLQYTHDVTKTYSLTSHVSGIAFHPKKESILTIASSSNCKVRVLDVEKQSLITELVPPSQTRRNEELTCGGARVTVSYSPDGEWLASAIAGRVHLWHGSEYDSFGHLSTIKSLESIDKLLIPNIVLWAKDQKSIYVVARNTIYIFKPAN